MTTTPTTMARVQSPPVFAQLRQARNFTEQASSLRALRTEIVGHVQQKEIWVQRGVLEALVQTLQETVKESGSAYDPTAELTEAEVVQLLCLQILDSISGDGPCFLPPLHAARTIPTVLPYISPVENPPKVVLFALRVIRNIRDATDLLPPGSDNNTDTLSGAVFAPACLESLYAILVQTRTDSVTQEQKRLVSVLISRLCKKPEHQNSLADAGILDALATMLASFVVSRGEVVPGADEFGEHDGLVNFIPSPAPQGASLALTLGAISAIIIGSRFHVYAFLCSPAILAVFPLLDFDPAGGQEAKAAWSGLEEHGYGDLGEKPQGAMEYLLPIIPVSQPRGLSVQFAQYTPLGFSSARDSNPSTARGTAYKFTGLDPSGENPDADDPGSPAIPWLMHLVRDTSGLERVAAADVLTSLYKAGFASPDREQALGPLVVTLLCELIKDHDKAIPDAVRQETLIEEEVAENWAILEKTPEVLARLVSDSECLQQAAHDCGTIVLAAKLLKDSYEAMPVQSPPKQWSPNPDSNINFDELPLSSQLGELGMLPLYAHRIRMRERALKLVASMATQKDELQKALSEQDVVPYVVESLTELPRKPQSAKEKQAAEKEGEDQENPQPLYGINPNEVIIAACHALRCISRSVSIVRTTLQDHEVWKPIVKLLKHPDSEVEIAASGAVINLLTSCSPMVGALTDVGIVKILCEHAHSQVPGLRLNALWGLKHLVLDVSVPLRKQILEELEPGWLVQLISDDNSEEDEAIQSARQRRAPDEDDDEDMGADATPYEEESRPWTWQVLSRDYPTPELSAAVANSSRIKKANARLLAVREAELNPARKARNDTIDIQEKGLGFIRNLTMLHKKEDQVEIVDHLFSVLGQDRLFGILADKLNIRVVGAYGRRHSKGRDTVVVYPQARIVENLTYILVHIAASVPRHRQLVIAQTELLKLLGGHFNDKDVGVRRALCHLFDNLSCLECEEDRQPCLSRTAELEKLGFLAKLEGLWHGDADLDVRERAKQVVEQMKTVS